MPGWKSKRNPTRSEREREFSRRQSHTLPARNASEFIYDWVKTQTGSDGASVSHKLGRSLGLP